MAAFRATSLFILFSLAACSVGEVPIGGGGGGGGGGAPDARLPVADASTIDASGTLTDATPGGSDPAATFTAIVTPIVTKMIGGKICSMAGCHGAGNTPPDLTSFASLQDKYKKKPGGTNILTTHGAHTGPALSIADAKAIADWINSLP